MQIKPNTDLGHPVPPRRSFRKTPYYSAISGPITYRLLILLPIVISIYAVPGTAHASIFSFVADLISKRVEESAVGRETNSQNMPLLEAARAIDPRSSVGGGDIIIVAESALLPESGPLGTLADIEETPANHQISLYTVRAGDSLSGIAKMFGVSVNTILWANDIGSGNVIREGQTLVILPVSGVRYRVAKGDTLGTIARKFGGDVKEIAQFNGLAINSTLSIGEEVIIPDGERKAVSPAAARSVARATNNNANFAGYYTRPIKGGVRSQGIHGYNGVDLATVQGAPLYASAAGEVIISREGGWNGGYGNYVVIAHANGTQTLYAHNLNNLVSVGQRVAQGQMIGTVGSTGRSTGPHVHFEVRGARNPF